MWQRRNIKTNEMEKVQVQGALRPIQLYEYVFPEEYLEEVLSMLEINPDNKKYGYSPTKLKMLRRMIGKDVKAVPSYTPKPTNRYVEKRGIMIYPIGIKKDKFKISEEFGYEQEML